MVHQIERFSVGGGKCVAIVLGAGKEDYFAALPWLKESIEKWNRREGMEISCVINPIPELGQFFSIQYGLKWLMQKNIRGAFLIPIDVPPPKKEVWEALMVGMKLKTEVSIPVFNDKGGHPVLLSYGFISKLVAVSPESEDARLDRQIHGVAKDHVNRIRVQDPAVILNLNTPEEFHSFCTQYAVCATHNTVLQDGDSTAHVELNAIPTHGYTSKKLADLMRHVMFW